MSLTGHSLILGRPTLANLRAITLITHMKMKFSTLYRVGEVRVDRQISGLCYSITLNLVLTTPKKKNNKGKGIMTIAQETTEEGPIEVNHLRKNT